MKTETLKKLQNYSGLIFLIFLIIHLFNHFTAIFGEKIYTTLYNISRRFYQNLIIETIILLSALIHMIIALYFWYTNKTTNTNTTFQKKIQKYGGWIMFFILPGHLIGTKIKPYLDGTDPDLSYISITLTHRVFGWIFVPYYHIYVLAAIGHVVISLYFVYVNRKNNNGLYFLIIFLTILVYLGIAVNFFEKLIKRDIQESYITFQKIKLLRKYLMII
jgi:uncharacterized membrane protein